MDGSRRKRRRVDDTEQRPRISRKLASRSVVKDVRNDEQYRRQMYAISVRDTLRKKSEA